MDAEKVFEVGGNDCNAYFKWTTEMDGVMLEVLREQKSKGQKEDRAFSAEAYRKVVEEINDKFSLNINKTKVMNRLKTLKEQMVLSKEIELKSGIGWNDSSKTFEAPLEVWKSLIKANPRYKNIKGKSLHHLEILREIYEKDVATGAQAESAREKVQRWEREETHISIDEIDEMQANNHVYLDKFSTFDFESVPSTSGSQFGISNPFVPNASVAKGKKRKAPMTNEYSSQLNEVSSAMKDIAQAILNTNTQVWKPAEIYEAVAKLGLEVDKLFEAVELLNEYPNLIGTILHLEGLDGDLKRTQRLKFWPPLDELLVEKYKFLEADVCKFTEFLCPLLDIASENRPTAAQCLQHPCLRIKDAKPRGEQNEAIVGKLEVGMTKLKVQVN
ncbi:uncharacterized protein LOC122003432 [Zingiber officinale]|uniref:uncharacterized protein LOC122003432 n=1 Tax=Zingiber officinale TaxID=94328 RepID=UPI001C4B14BE|nr:uncharacterized protein LOC122003432 [Zingiber officinale]